jgi:glycosyltransferase involved in cell wall biosynthesis
VSPDQLLRRIAAFGLPELQTHRQRPCDDPEQPDRLADRPLEPPVFDPLIGRVRSLRLSGFLLTAVATGALPTTDEQRRRVDELHTAACISVLQLERRLLQLIDVLEANGIDVVVLKGTSAAHLLYPDPTQRMFGDNDLLFRTQHFDRALAVLAALGYRRPMAAPRPGFDSRFGKGATLLGLDGDELDAHRTLLFGTFGLTIDTDELFASTVPFHLGGRELRALGPDTGLLHACYHAALGDPDPRLGSVRDVAQRFALGQHDPTRVCELMGAWRAAPVVSRAVELCDRLLDVQIDDPVATRLAAYRPTRREQRAIASYVGVERSHVRKVLASLPYLDGVVTKAAFLRANLVPTATYLRARTGRRDVAGANRGRQPMPARVLWLTKGLGLGGAERLLTSVAAGIDRERFEVEVAYLLPWKDAFVAELEAEGVNAVCLGARRTLDPRWVLRLRVLLRRRDYALVHTHSPVPAAVARLLVRAPTRLVHTEHNVWGRYRWPTYAANALTYGRNDASIAVSDAVADSMVPPRWAPGTAPAVETLLHGVNLAEVPRGPAARRAARAGLDISDAIAVIGIVANFTPKKDHAGLLTAFDEVRRQIPDVVLLLIGSGPLEDELRREVAARDLADNVRFLGSRDDVPALLPALDVFVLSSRFEGLPIALLEAMAAEVACVVTSVGGIPEAVTDHVEGRLVPPDEPDTLAGALLDVLRDDDARAAMAAAGFERVSAGFSIDRAIARTQELYDQLLRPSREPR